MDIWERFDLWPQCNWTPFVPMKVLHEVIADIPDITGVRVNGCKNVKQVLDIHVLRHDPRCILEARVHQQIDRFAVGRCGCCGDAQRVSPTDIPPSPTACIHSTTEPRLSIILPSRCGPYLNTVWGLHLI